MRKADCRMTGDGQGQKGNPGEIREACELALKLMGASASLTPPANPGPAIGDLLFSQAPIGSSGIVQHAQVFMATSWWSAAAQVLGAVLLLCLSRRIAKWLVRTDDELTWPGSEFRLVSVRGSGFASSSSASAFWSGRFDLCVEIHQPMNHGIPELLALPFGLYLIRGGDWFVRSAWGIRRRNLRQAATDPGAPGMSPAMAIVLIGLLVPHHGHFPLGGEISSFLTLASSNPSSRRLVLL